VNWLPVGTLLGELELVEIFVEYDGPRLFSVRSATDQFYLAEWAAGLANADLWLYVPVSATRLAATRSGGLSVRAAFANPEGIGYLVTMHFDTSLPDEVELVPRSQIEEDWLPAEDFHLSLQTATHRPAGTLEDLRLKAYQDGRAMFRVEIDAPDVFVSESSTRSVSSVLGSLQNVFDNFGLVEIADDPKATGSFEKRVKDRMETDVLELQAASFVIEIGAHDREDLFGDSPIAKVGERLVNLLAVDIGQQELLDELIDLKPRAAKSFRKFVNELQALRSTVVVAAASSYRGVKGQQLSYEQLINLSTLLKEILPTEVREIRGRMVLVAGDVPNRKFGLEDRYDDAAYEGGVSERALVQLDHAPLMGVYDVLITEYANQQKAIGETNRSYRLEQLSPAEDATPIPATFTVVTTADDVTGLWS